LKHLPISIRNFTKVVQAKMEGKEADKIYQDFPTVEDGVRGMKFIDAVIAFRREQCRLDKN
jgi:hypothetical protein